MRRYFAAIAVSIALALAFAVIGGAAAGPADGTWEVQLPGGGGARGCSGDLVVR